MIELIDDTLQFSFPDLEHQPRLSIGFQRTLRIPDDEKSYPLPPGLGNFPMQHIDDLGRGLPESMRQRGGVALPMWQAEALWVHFEAHRSAYGWGEYPFAIKIATGKINAVSGENWHRGLHRSPQDYVVVPEQPWLDGYCVEEGTIRQFVAMPLGQGYSVEEQITGEAEFGGLQIEVIPMRPEAFERHFKPEPRADRLYDCDMACMEKASLAMGLGAGGKMRQEIYDDPYELHDWDIENSRRCFIHLINAEHWQALTGRKSPSQPPTASDYTDAGLPWFDYYAPQLKALPGSGTLAKVKTVKEFAQEKGESPLPENTSCQPGNIKKLRQGLQQNEVRTESF